MRKILLSFTFLASIIVANGQERQIKQLEQQIAAHPQRDTFRVNRLIELAQIPSISAGKTDTLATEAFGIAKKLDYDRGQGLALVNKGLALSRLGKREQ